MSLFQVADEEPFADDIAFAQSHRAVSIAPMRTITLSTNGGEQEMTDNQRKSGPKESSNSRQSSSTKQKIKAPGGSDEAEEKEQFLTAAEQAVLKQRKLHKKQSKLREKYELESLRETYLKLEEENTRLRDILVHSHLEPDLVAQILEQCSMSEVDERQGQQNDSPSASVTSNRTEAATGNGVRRRLSIIAYEQNCEKDIDVDAQFDLSTSISQLNIDIAQEESDA